MQTISPIHPDHNQILDQLSALVERHTLPGVILLLGEVASAKADKSRDILKDEYGAGIWDRYAAECLGMAHRLTDPQAKWERTVIEALKAGY